MNVNQGANYCLYTSLIFWSSSFSPKSQGEILLKGEGCNTTSVRVVIRVPKQCSYNTKCESWVRQLSTHVHSANSISNYSSIPKVNPVWVHLNLENSISKSYSITMLARLQFLISYGETSLWTHTDITPITNILNFWSLPKLLIKAPATEDPTWPWPSSDQNFCSRLLLDFY